MMAEGVDVSNCNQENGGEGKRQDGDGYDSNTGVGAASSTRTDLDLGALVKEENTEEKNELAENLEQRNDSVTKSTTIAVPVSSSPCKKPQPESQHSQSSPARAVLSSQRELRLRHQFRQLHSQELIRRILKSTGVIPNNVARPQSPTTISKQSIVDAREGSPGNGPQSLPGPGPLESCLGRSDCPKQNNLRTEGEAASEQQVLGTPKESKHIQVGTSIPNTPTQLRPITLEEPIITVPGCPGVAGPQGPVGNVNKKDLEEGSVKNIMQAPDSFVCSVCNTSGVGTEYDKNLSQLKEATSLQSTQGGSVISLSSPNSEEEQEKEKGSYTLGPSSDTNVQTPRSSAKPDVLQLSERLQQQPSHEMLDEILKLLQSQTMSPPRQDAKQAKPVLQQTNVAVNKLRDDLGGITNDTIWKRQQQQFMMMGAQPNLREKHSRQLADMKDYYEGEIVKLRDQLEMLRGNLSVLQEAIPVKLLEATNHRLDARCNLMEEIAADLKAKCQKHDQNNQELEGTCFELRQANEAIEMRCLLLQKSNQELDDKYMALLNNNKVLQSKILHLTQANEKTASACKQLEEANKHFERTCKELEESKYKIEARYRKGKEENLTLAGDVRDLQETLLLTNKRTQELEDTITSLHNERRDWGLKLEASQKLSEAAQNRYKDLKMETDKKQSVLNKMEEQMGLLSTTFEATTKANDDLQKNAERDKELLKRLLVEYDALAKEHQQSKASSYTLAEQVNSSQDEVSNLRGTVTKLIYRNSNLEESLREALVQRSGPTTKSESTPPSLRKTWGSPVPLKAEHSDHSTHHSLALEYDVLGRGPRTSSPVKSDYGSTTVADVSRVTTGAVMPYKQQSPKASSGIKFEIPWEKQKSSRERSAIHRNLEKSYTTSPEKLTTKSPVNLVVKKSDLVTRFDVVFEDINSGEELMRSHTGRTSRALGESPASIFVSSSGTNVAESSQRLVSDAAEAALSALRSGRVTSHGGWENKNTTIRKGRRERSNEMKAIRSADEHSEQKREHIVGNLERKFSTLAEERKRLESTLSRIPGHRITKRSKEDKAFLENRLDDVVKEIGSVRMQLRRHHAL